MHGSFICNRQNWKQPRCYSMGKCLNKLWYIHTREYYPATIRNKLLMHETTWMNFQVTMLSEKKCQWEKPTCCPVSFTSSKGKKYRAGKLIVLPGVRDWGESRKEMKHGYKMATGGIFVVMELFCSVSWLCGGDMDQHVLKLYRITDTHTHPLCWQN